MNQELGLKVLSEIMLWTDEQAREEFAWLRFVARLKYDGYRDFRAGVRFIESLATWLQQFEREERNTAYNFVRRVLVYIGPSELHKLVELFYPKEVYGRIVADVVYWFSVNWRIASFELDYANGEIHHAKKAEKLHGPREGCHPQTSSG